MQGSRAGGSAIEPTKLSLLSERENLGAYFDGKAVLGTSENYIINLACAEEAEVGCLK